MQALALLLQPPLGAALPVVLLVRLQVLQGVLLLLVSLLRQLAFQRGGALLSRFPVLRQPLSGSLVVHGWVLAEEVGGLLPPQPGIGVLRTVAVGMGEPAKAAIF